MHFLPPYAPHLNPDELVNADLKRTLADQVITSPDQMHTRSDRSSTASRNSRIGSAATSKPPYTVYASII
ncbi:transposase [Nocardia sp. NPDC059764]|uniref:transposase n=1 Tax=Nocardia sp. NPDC059764 TaxID=3346939 RepID=UPI0036607377